VGESCTADLVSLPLPTEVGQPLTTKQRSVAIRTQPVIARTTAERESEGKMRLSRLLYSRYGAYYRSHGVSSAEMAEASWYKSSVSSYNGNCVEISHLRDGLVAVRDTKDRASGPALIFTRPEWDAFLTGAKNGEFDPA
jgi:hypothetical protein